MLDLPHNHKSILVYCTLPKPSRLGTDPKLFVRGPPEGIPKRCMPNCIGMARLP